LTYCRNTNFQCFAVTPGVRSRSKYCLVTEGRFSSSQRAMFSSSRKICSHTSLVSVSGSASAVPVRPDFHVLERVGPDGCLDDLVANEQSAQNLPNRYKLGSRVFQRGGV